MNEDERIGVYVISEREESAHVLRQASRDTDKMGCRHLWARGYYVTTIGNVNEETIRKYIREQEENDKLEDGSR